MNRRPFALVLTVLLAAAGAASAARGASRPAPDPVPTTGTPATGPTERWRGEMRRGRAAVPVEVALPPEPGVAATFTAPDLGAVGVPLANVRVSAGTVHFELAGDRTTTVFDGRRTGDDAIAGTFTDAGGPGTFTLRRAAGPASPYRKEEVSFANGAVRLAGSVLVPPTPGRHRGAVLVQGSGPEGRWAMLPLAHALARAGIEALVFDKRGVGASGGDWRTATLDDLAGDVRAAVRLLARRPDVDPAALGVYGHSQGAEIAPAVARDAAVRWIVAADGPVGPQYRQDLFRVRNALAKKYSGRELADAMRVYADFVDVARSGSPHAPLRAEIARAGNARWLADLAIPPDASWIWRWYRGVGDYDNRAAWAAVRVPVLLLYGGNDELVPPRASIAEITSLLRAHARPQLGAIVYPNADHTLRIAPRERGGWPRYAPGYPDAVVRWIARTPSP